MSSEADVLRRTGILVLGHRRPELLRNLLESLRRQNALALTHVWIDGHGGIEDLYEPVLECERVAREFAPPQVLALNGHLGIEKLMLDALGLLCREHEAVIVLEDDCFPSRNAVVEFARALGRVRRRKEIFSVYGHHFLVPGEDGPFPRFQGWGWAAWSARLQPILTAARRCFDMPEPEYLAWVEKQLTRDVRRRLAVTPGRDPIHVARGYFSWDSCFALLTARRRLMHCPTARRVIFNCGMGMNSSHFPEDDDLRRPPFNMVAADEVWRHFGESRNDKCAVVYVASKQEFAEEALESARSVRRRMRDVVIYLKTDGQVRARGERWRVFDSILRVEGIGASHVGKYCFLEGVSESKVLYLDTDTYVAGDLRPGFNLLNRFDIACAHAPFRLARGGGPEIPRPAGIPEAFPDLNTGVIFCRNNARVRRLFERCQEEYAALANGDEGMPDQPAFRSAAWNSEVALYVLPPEYNARLCFPTFLSGEAKILHCRFDSMERVAERVNADLHLRTFFPEKLDELQ
ncbi:MAG TPA: hypothetical protein VGF59_03815 [Bryobacteraceae bacterium]